VKIEPVKKLLPDTLVSTHSLQRAIEYASKVISESLARLTTVPIRVEQLEWPRIGMEVT
jgi:hypothetical protein